MRKDLMIVAAALGKTLSDSRLYGSEANARVAALLEFRECAIGECGIAFPRFDPHEFRNMVNYWWATKNAEKQPVAAVRPTEEPTP